MYKCHSSPSRRLVDTSTDLTRLEDVDVCMQTVGGPLQRDGVIVVVGSCESQEQQGESESSKSSHRSSDA